MRRYCLMLILFVVLVIAGCGSPEPEPTSDIYQKYQKLNTEHIALQSVHDVLLLNYESQKKAKQASDNCCANYNELLNEHRNLQIELGVLKAYSYSQNAYYEEMFAGLSSGMIKDTEALDVLNEQYQELANRYKIVNEQLAALNVRKAKVISDNLTADELKVFYRGWDLWWGTFNK